MKKRDRNTVIKTQMKNAVKAVRTAGADKAENMTDTLVKATSVIAIAAKKGVIHRNTAARKISRLSKLTNKIKA